MGTFVGSAHVLTQERPAAEFASEVISSIDEWMARQGFTRTEAADWDRAVVIGANGDDWVTVHDSVHHRRQSLASLGSAFWLSDALGAYAVSYQLDDSDVATTALWHEGRLVDRFMTWPDIYWRLSDKELLAMRGHPERWLPVLIGQADPPFKDRVTALERIMSSRWDAEEVLSGLDSLLGLGELRTYFSPWTSHGFSEIWAEEHEGRYQTITYRVGDDGVSLPPLPDVDPFFATEW